jgi:hypothetical protein
VSRDLEILQSSVHKRQLIKNRCSSVKELLHYNAGKLCEQNVARLKDARAKQARLRNSERHLRNLKQDRSLKNEDKALKSRTEQLNERVGYRKELNSLMKLEQQRNF